MMGGATVAQRASQSGCEEKQSLKELANQVVRKNLGCSSVDAEN